MLEKLTEKFSDLSRQLSGQSKISDKNIEDAVNEIKMALLDADVNIRVVRRFVNHTIEEARGEKVLKAINPGQMFIKLVHDRMVTLLGDSKQDLILKGPDTVSSILFLGLNGAGKTTTAAKLAARLKSEGRRPLLVACDLARPAAVQQLKVLGEQTNVEVYAEESQNPVKVAKNALKHAKKFQFNTVIFDTAGRLQIDADLMKQIKEIKDAVKPDETILVADAMTGQSAVDIAKTFDEELDLSGVILSKFDSDTRGGAALSLKSITGKAIKFIGVGEKIENLEPFYPERIASRILGMGDIVSLVEKAQETASEEEALQLQKKMASATFSLEDYLEQFQRMRKMGSVQSLVGMLPGLAGKVSEEDIDENALKREEAIILSMTRKERQNHRIIGPPRKKRIALGSGSTVADVNKLLKNFEKMRLMMKKISKNKKYQAQLMQQFGGMS
jgi:signal recognition particle subunit SRP54